MTCVLIVLAVAGQDDRNWRHVDDADPAPWGPNGHRAAVGNGEVFVQTYSWLVSPILFRFAKMRLGALYLGDLV